MQTPSATKTLDSTKLSSSPQPPGAMLDSSGAPQLGTSFLAASNQQQRLQRRVSCVCRVPSPLTAPPTTDLSCRQRHAAAAPSHPRRLHQASQPLTLCPTCWRRRGPLQTHTTTTIHCSLDSQSTRLEAIPLIPVILDPTATAELLGLAVKTGRGLLL